MNKRLIISIGAATAFLAVAVFWRSYPSTPPAGPTATAAELTRLGPSSSLATPVAIADARKSLRERQLNFDSVTRISQVEGNSHRAVEGRGQALEYLRTAAEYCEARALDSRFRTQRELKGQLSPAERETLVYQRAFGAKFCDSSVENSAEIAAKFLTLGSDDDVLTAHMLPSLEGDEASTTGVPIASALIRKSKSPDAIARAARFLLFRSEDLPQTKRVPLPASIRGEKARMEAQMLAVSMLTCEMRGGCGPSGFYTALNCGNYCRAGVSLNDVWTKSNSPDTIEYARSIAAAMKADRSGIP